MSKIQPCYGVLGRAIRRHRKAFGWTQDDLAMIIGLSRTSIVNIESGVQRVPYHTVLEFVIVFGFRDLNKFLGIRP